MMRIGHDRVGIRPREPATVAAIAPVRGEHADRGDRCPLDGERGVFRRTALVCPRCGRLLGGI